MDSQVALISQMKLLRAKEVKTMITATRRKHQKLTEGVRKMTGLHRWHFVYYRTWKVNSKAKTVFLYPQILYEDLIFKKSSDVGLFK